MFTIFKTDYFQKRFLYKRNVPLENMIEHIKSCHYIIFIQCHLKLNTEEIYTNTCYCVVYKLEESRDWFIIKPSPVNGNLVFYIMHHSEEETKDVFYYSKKYLDDRNKSNLEQ